MIYPPRSCSSCAAFQRLRRSRNQLTEIESNQISTNECSFHTAIMSRSSVHSQPPHLPILTPFSPEETFLALTKATSPVDEATLAAAFAALPPITDPTFMLSEWTGTSLSPSHPGHAALTAMKWVGKNFRAVNDVSPIMVLNDAGERVEGEGWGGARLRMVELWGKVSVAMVYDTKPIIDQFRFVTGDLVAGAMDVKPDSGKVFYFTLKRNGKEGEKL